MIRILNVPLTLLSTLILTGASVCAQEPIRFARHPDLSPDGKLVAFSYLGDIWTVEAIGGLARPVTMHQAHEVYPVFSPDGRWIAFSSNRHGSYDIFVAPVYGGKPRRVTFDSAADIVNAWTPDGKSILFTSTRGTAFPLNQDLYLVPAEGGRAVRVSAGEGRDGSFSPKADQLAYVRGPGTWYRQGYRGSSNDDIWLCNPDGTNNRRLTSFDGQDVSPMWAPDGQFLYYVTEHHGTPANIVRQDIAGKSPPQLVTFHKDQGVRRARLSGNGEWIVYECGTDLWIAATREGTPPRRLAIEVHADDKVNAEQIVTFSRDASEFALSPDESHVAFVVHGSIFLMPMEGKGKPRRLTQTPAYDHGIAWAPDSNKILFLSDRNGREDIYLLEPNDPEHPKLVEAHQFKVKPLTDTLDPEAGVSFTPDGKRVAYLRGGHLWTMNPDGTDQKILVKDKMVIDYEFSADGKWVAFARLDGSFASELYVMPAAGGEARNVTRYATWNAGVTWSKDGKKLAFLSERRGNPSMYVLSLQKPAAPGAPSSSDIDWEDIHLRVEQPAPAAAVEGAISPDGSRVAFRSRSSSGDDLWVASVEGGQLTRVTTGNLRPTQIHWSRKLPSTIYFRDGTGVLRMARVGLSGLDALFAGAGRSPGSRSSSAGDAVAVPFSVKMTIRREEEFTEMFDQSWRALAEQFYDPKFHGVDWYTIRSKYRPVVKHIAMKEDLYSLIYLMLGELNASHLGISGPGKSPEEVTADLGLLLDETYRGPGLKIAEVLKRGPADQRGITLRAGEYIASIDGTPITEKTDLSQLLNGKAGETVVLQVTSNPKADPRDPKAFRRVELKAVDRSTVANLMYERWVVANARRVAELSKGKLGYIHIPSMDEAGLDRFVRALYSDNFEKDAIVLDVRYNGGGFTHDQVLNYLGAREHTFFRQRYGGEGLVLRPYDRKWSRPLVLLVNNRSYSDAEIFPSAFKTLGLGKVVGQPTGAQVIGTGGVQLIDGSLFRIPRIGVYTVRGENMERVGVTPDVLVEPHPDELARGVDVQLDKAVEVLMHDVVAWKKSHPGLTRKPEAARPGTPSGPTGTGLPTGK